MAAQEKFAASVASHYNQVEQKSIRDRKKSDIIELRSFNNAMKSLMHQIAYKYVNQTKTDKEPIRLLDLGCGKGGDLKKYQANRRIGLVVGCDIADVSIEQCKGRYDTMRNHSQSCFAGKFFVADLTRKNIRDNLEDLGITDKFHIASSQFSIHYSFESYEQAIRYISNAADNLEPHGIFIGTYPDGPKLLKMARESETPGKYQVGDILDIEFSPDNLKNPLPFGTKYHFKLKEVVDCPEFLVHPEVIGKIMKSLGFFQIFDRSFKEFLDSALSGPDRDSVKKLFENHNSLKIECLDDGSEIAKLDEDMWKASSIYRCFCYRKL